MRLALRRRRRRGELRPLLLWLLLDRPLLLLRLGLRTGRRLFFAAAEADIGEAAEQAERPAILLGLPATVMRFHLALGDGREVLDLAASAPKALPPGGGMNGASLWWAC